MAEIQMTNKMESVVTSVVENFLRDHPDLCSCERCKFDMIALTLNGLPAKYVVTTLGDVVTGVTLHGIQGTADVMMALMPAVAIVRQKPRH